MEHVVSEWCKMHHVDPKSHMAVMEGLRVLYMMREFDMTDRDELLKELLASDDAGPEARQTPTPGPLSALSVYDGPDNRELRFCDGAALSIRCRDKPQKPGSYLRTMGP